MAARLIAIVYSISAQYYLQCYYCLLSLKATSQREPAGRVIMLQAGRQSSKMNVSLLVLFCFCRLTADVITGTLVTHFTVEQPNGGYIFIKEVTYPASLLESNEME